MPVEVHIQGQGRGVRTCSECQQRAETGWHCSECEDYDLCISCYDTKGHPHNMVKVGPGLDGEAKEGEEGGHPREPQLLSLREMRRQSILRCIQSLRHARQCYDADCSDAACRKMKRVVQHSKGCQRKTNGGCPVCKQLIALCCFHAKQCRENPCPIPFCLNIKMKLRQHRLRLYQQRFGNRLPQG